MKYTWLLFDADDTLFDFPRAEANALRWTLDSLGLPASPDYFEIYARCNLTVWKEFERGLLTSLELRAKRFRLFFDEVGITADPETVSPLYLQNLALGTDLLPHAEEVIRFLRPRFHLGLVTNGLADVQRPGSLARPWPIASKRFSSQKKSGPPNQPAPISTPFSTRLATHPKAKSSSSATA